MQVLIYWRANGNYDEGTFKVSSPLEILRETKTILNNLEVHSHFLSDHISNYANINGKLPEDKKNLLTVLDRLIRKALHDTDFLCEITDPVRSTRL